MAGRPGKRLKQVQQFILDAEKLLNEVGNITVEMFCDPIVNNSKSDCWWDATAHTQDAVWSLERLLAELQKGVKGSKKPQEAEHAGNVTAREGARGGIFLTRYRHDDGIRILPARQHELLVPSGRAEQTEQ